MRLRRHGTQEFEPIHTTGDAWSVEADAEIALYQAQQMRRAMQTEVWAGAGVLGCILSVASVFRGRDWAKDAIAVAQALLLWAAVVGITRWSARLRRAE